MPRKAFVADLAKAVESVSIVGVSNVQTGNDDGEFTFLCVADGQELKISVLIPGMSHEISPQHLFAGHRMSCNMSVVSS
jgi:ubiquitin-conjugating enzyme E2 Q